MFRVPFQSLIFHELKGIPGWSGVNKKIIDVAMVKEINFRKRLFRLIDREYPYTLNILYYDPHFGTSVFTTGGRRVNVSEAFCESYITRRLKSEHECLSEFNEIIEKQNKLE